MDVPSPTVQLHNALENAGARVGIIGLGYVGLPLVRAFYNAGFHVTGFDTDAEKIAKLSAGRSYISSIPDGVIAAMVGAGRFVPTADFHKLRESHAIVICVPTPLTDTREPDLSYVIATAETIAAHLQPGQLVVLESTTYPGTTRDVVRPILERGGLVAGRDFFLAYSPEREDPGNPQHTAAAIPKLVGGIDAESAALAVALYQRVVVQVVPVASAEVAEAAKILENTYRAVNIALVNELKILFTRMGIDIWQVIDAAKTKPFGFQAFYPGPGLGGHCIPIDPFYLAWLARRYEFPTRFIELAGEINTAMPDYVVTRTAEALNARGKPVHGSRIAILGVAYKKDVDDPRESPAFVIMEKLLRAGALVSYNDPHIPRLPRMRRHQLDLASQPLTPEFLQSQDCVVLITDHSAYDLASIVPQCALFVDTRGATRRLANVGEIVVQA